MLSLKGLNILAGRLMKLLTKNKTQLHEAHICNCKHKQGSKPGKMQIFEKEELRQSMNEESLCFCFSVNGVSTLVHHILSQKMETQYNHSISK